MSMPVSRPSDFKQERAVFGVDIAGSAGSERTAAEPGKRGIETANADVDRGGDVGNTEAAGIMKMRAQRHLAERPRRRREQPPHLRRVSIADRVGQHDLVGAGLRQRLGNRENARLGHRAFDRAAEGGRDRSRQSDITVRSARIAFRDDLPELIERLIGGTPHIGKIVLLARGQNKADLAEAKHRRRGWRP